MANMPLKLKYRGGKVGTAKPRVVDVTGKTVYPPPDSRPVKHRNFLEGGIYYGQ